MLMLIPPALAKESDHHIPFRLTWILLDRESSDNLYQMTCMAPIEHLEA